MRLLLTGRILQVEAQITRFWQAVHSIFTRISWTWIHIITLVWVNNPAVSKLSCWSCLLRNNHRPLPSLQMNHYQSISMTSLKHTSSQHIGIIKSYLLGFPLKCELYYMDPNKSYTNTKYKSSRTNSPEGSSISLLSSPSKDPQRPQVFPAV